MVHRRTVGRYQLFERKPRIPALQKFVVIWADGDRSFSKYGKAVRWMKDQRTLESGVDKPKGAGATSVSVK